MPSVVSFLVKIDKKKPISFFLLYWHLCSISRYCMQEKGLRNINSSGIKTIKYWTLTYEHRMKKIKSSPTLFELVFSQIILQAILNSQDFSELLHIISTTIYHSYQCCLSHISAEVPKKCWCCCLASHHQFILFIKKPRGIFPPHQHNLYCL